TIRITEEELNQAKKIVKNPWKRGYLYFKSLGPGLITGAADDDPGGIGTYSSVGAAFGYKIIWLSLWLLPLMLAVQETCARIGIITNRGLAGVLKKHYTKKLVALVVILLIIANIANIGADIGAMASSTKLIVNLNFNLLAIVYTILIILIEILIPYHLYSKILKFLTLSLIAYIITGFIIHPQWWAIIKETIIPDITFKKEYIFAVVAVFGTTISPYLFFWQTSEEVEENIESQKLKPVSTGNRIANMRTDVKSGMVFSNLVMFFIIVTTASVLFKNGIQDIGSAEQAAQALRPLVGDKAFLLFALGIVGTGLLAIPILAGSGAYALSELMNWREGLSNKFSKAKSFYLVIAISILLGLSINFLGIPPIKALYYSAFLNGIIAVPLLFVIMIVGNDQRIMGEETHPRWVKFFGWGAVVFSFLAVITYLLLSVDF
ncbi:divalent metal cation transporter, partial [Patescibacteria group bacterium]|nr:divalent metal cation transporter [Patescibacteria group bacterium]